MSRKPKNKSSVRTHPNMKVWETPELIEAREAQEAAMHKAGRKAIGKHARHNRPSPASRVGLTVLDSAAVGILAARKGRRLREKTKASLGSKLHSAIAKKGESASPKLHRKYETRTGNEVSPSRLHRLGNFALKATATAVEKISRRSSKRSEQLKGRAERLSQPDRGGIFATGARNWAERRVRQIQKQQAEQEEAYNEGRSRYREEHPEIAERERIERRGIMRHKKSIEIGDTRKWTTEYFKKGRLGSFSKAIPRRPIREGRPGFTGDYTELAKDTLSTALESKKEDGTVPLLDSRVQEDRIAQREKQGETTAFDAELRYSKGVATTLWKLGFVEYDKEDDIGHGGRLGRFNENIEWGETEDPAEHARTARIPFNSDNELHQMVTPEVGDMANPMVEVEMSDGGSKGNYMDLRVVDAVPATPEEARPNPPMAAAA